MAENVSDYLTELERQLELAEATIAELERELQAWRSGAKSAAAETVKQRLGE